MIINKQTLKAIILEEINIFAQLSKITLLEVKDISFDNPLKVLKAFAKKLAIRGYDVSSAKELGSGVNGTAYAIAGNKVLKITKDDFEARAANHLKNKSLKHVIPIYDVFKFKTNIPNQEWFGIIEAQAQKLSEQEKEYFNQCVDLILKNAFFSSGNPWTMDWNELKTNILDTMRIDPENLQAAQKCFSFLEKLEFNKLMQELKQNNVEYFDVHADNFMKYRGKLVLVDLGGHSQSPGKIPPLLEKQK